MNFNNSNTCMYYNFTMNKKTTLMNSKTEHYQVLSVHGCISLILLNVFKILIIKEIETGQVNLADHKSKSCFFIILVVNHHMYYVNSKILINPSKHASHRYPSVSNTAANTVSLYRSEQENMSFTLPFGSNIQTFGLPFEKI